MVGESELKLSELSMHVFSSFWIQSSFLYKTELTTNSFAEDTGEGLGLAVGGGGEPHISDLI